MKTKKIKFGILFTSLALLITNFLPEKYLVRYHLEKFLSDYDPYILIVFLVSFFLIVIHFVRDRTFHKYMKKEQDNLFQDKDALAILFELYKYHPKAVSLPINNQKVFLLQKYQLIKRATSEAVVSDITNPKFPYILQPEAERRLKELVAKE